MGRSYWFECSRCGYRAKVSGRGDRGLDFFVQTIVCQDCKSLYDAVTRVRVPREPAAQGKAKARGTRAHQELYRAARVPPTFQSLLSRLPSTGIRRCRWLSFNLQCPVSSNHRVQPWNDPGNCPRCGLHLEKNVLPYRIWT